MGGKVGVLLEVNCETDFVAKTDDFKELVHDIALQIAPLRAEYVSRDEVRTDHLDHEKEILAARPATRASRRRTSRRWLKPCRQVLQGGLPAEQPFVKNPDMTIEQMINEKIAKNGEKISVRRFVRYKMGEGLEKRSTTWPPKSRADRGDGKK
jgi:elongation factor Ts